MSRLTAATPHTNEEKIKEAWAEDKAHTAHGGKQHSAAMEAGREDARQ